MQDPKQAPTADTFMLTVENANGDTYTVRLHGESLAMGGGGNYSRYATEDKRLFIYDEKRMRLNEVKDASEVWSWRDDDPAFYAAAMEALGEDSAVDNGQAKS